MINNGSNLSLFMSGNAIPLISDTMIELADTTSIEKTIGGKLISYTKLIDLKLPKLIVSTLNQIKTPESEKNVCESVIDNYIRAENNICQTELMSRLHIAKLYIDAISLFVPSWKHDKSLESDGPTRKNAEKLYIGTAEPFLFLNHSGIIFSFLTTFINDECSMRGMLRRNDLFLSHLLLINILTIVVDNFELLQT